MYEHVQHIHIDDEQQATAALHTIGVTASQFAQPLQSLIGVYAQPPEAATLSLAEVQQLEIELTSLITPYKQISALAIVNNKPTIIQVRAAVIINQAFVIKQDLSPQNGQRTWQQSR